MALFKSQQTREAERRIRIRRAKSRLSRQVGRLQQQRDRYIKMGEEAARQGKRDKVRLLARAVLQFRRMEKRFQDVLITLELFEAQKEMMTLQSEFVQAMKACTLSIRDADVTRQLAQMEAEFEQALESVDQANDQIDAFLEGGQEALVAEGEQSAEGSELTDLEREFMQSAVEQEVGSTPDAISADLSRIEEELKREN
jgi:hypothetical protein